MKLRYTEFELVFTFWKGITRKHAYPDWYINSGIHIPPQCGALGMVDFAQ